MTWLNLTAHVVIALIFLVGLVGSLLPAMPGSLVIWIGVLIHKLWMGDFSVSWQIVVLTGVITAFGLIADFVFGYWGAKQFGATWRGAVGAVIGALLGLFIPPPLFWLIFGPIVGAVVGELTAGRDIKAGGKAGIGTLIGGVLAFAVKFGLSLCVIAIFYFSLVVGW